MSNKPDIPLHLFEIMEEEYVNLYGQPPERYEDDGTEVTPKNPPSARRRGVKIWLPDRGGEVGEVEGRVIWAGRDWYFRRGHLIDPAGLAAEILNVGAAEAAGTPSHIYDEWAKENLREHLVKLMDKKVLEAFVRLKNDIHVTRQKLGEASAEEEKLTPEREAAQLKVERAFEDVSDAERDKLTAVSARLGELAAQILELRKQLAALQSGLEASDVPLRKELDKLLDNRGLYSGERFPSEWLSTTPMIEGLVALHEKTNLEGDALRQLNRLLLERAFPKYIERIHHIRVAAAVQQFHARRPAALSLSGGGIRSGTFALGVLQGLARHDLLKRFDYLSTVSGGGYVGAWLTAWLSRHPEGLEGVTRDLANHGPVSKIDPEPRPIRYLREYSNFLTPKVGAMTADTWSFVGIYLRNLLLNWGVFLPLFLAVLMLPRILLTYTLYQPTERPRPAAEALGLSPEELDAVPKMKEVPQSLRVVYQAEPYSWGRNFFDKPILRNVFWGGTDERDKHLYPRHLLLPLGFLFGVWALGYVGFNRPGLRETLRERSKFWRDRSDQRSFLWACLLPLILSALFMTTYWAWSQEASSSVKGLGYFLGFGLAFTIGGSLISSLVLRRWRWRGAWRFRENSLRELVSVIVAGLLGGILFWILAAPMGDPIKGYGVVARRVGEGSGPLDWAVTSAPLAWTDWTSWHWWSWTTELYICLAVPVFLLVFWTGVTMFVGLTSWNPKVSDEDREWWARFGAWLLIAPIVWVGLSATVIFGPLVLLQFPKLLTAVGSVSGLVAVLVGKSASTPARAGAADEKDTSKAGAASRLLTSSLPLLGLVFLLSVAAGLSLLTTGITRKVALKAAEVCHGRLDNFDASVRVQGWGWDYKVTPHALEEAITNVPSYDASAGAQSPYGGFGAGDQPPGAGIDSYREFITPVVPKLAEPVKHLPPLPNSAPCTPACPSPAEADAEIAEHTADDYVGAGIVHLNVLHHTSHWFTIVLAGLLFVVGMLLSWLMNLNYFSLHGGYRNRLIRAFLGASRPAGQRKPNPFTGFDASDNMSMHELRPALLDEDDILDQTALYEELLNQSNQMSKYLKDRDMLASVENEPSSTPSPSLVHALRTDLNAILESEELYKLPFATKIFEKGRTKRILESIRAEQSPNERNADERDDIRGSYRVLLNRLVLESLYPKMFRPCSYPPPPYKLLHVINTSLNLVGGEKLAWQQRKAEPFSITPLHSGCFRLGYRRSRLYGGKNTGGISIGTAAAISGAAASSNMGYYTTSPIISLLLTLFNVRLGWWLGNPGSAGQKTYELANPTLSVSPVLYEAFGLTNDRYKYVYLTDGGHFENLALYEMVLRRCHLIVVSDAAADGDYRFGDLGNAVRKIRIDLGVPIEFHCFDIYGWDEARAKESKGEESKGMYWAVGRIRYSCVDKADVDENGMPVTASDGIIIYLKPALYGDEPRDVLEYRENFPAFPHQSTGDQFFDEPQFESYRALGSHIMDRMCGSAFEPLDLERMMGLAFSAARKHCPEAFAKFGDDDEMPDPNAEDTTLFGNWLDKVKDCSLRDWLGELAWAERGAHNNAERRPPAPPPPPPKPKPPKKK